MGAPMARSLLANGYKVTVWNRTKEKSETLTSHGAQIATSAADAVLGANFVISMVADGAVTKALTQDAIIRKSLGENAIWADMSSIKPEEARAQSMSLSDIGIHHLDAPVSGGTKGADAATLAIMVGGERSVFDQAIPVFEAMGRPVYVGPSGTGQLSKLANQAIVAITIGAVAEAMLLAENGGADPSAVRQALKGGFADSVILQQHGERMTTGNFEPGGLSKTQLKDLNNTLNEAAGFGLKLPSTKAMRDRFETLVSSMDGAELDHSAIYLELLKQNEA